MRRGALHAALPSPWMIYMCPCCHSAHKLRPMCVRSPRVSLFPPNQAIIKAAVADANRNLSKQHNIEMATLRQAHEGKKLAMPRRLHQLPPSALAPLPLLCLKHRHSHSTLTLLLYVLHTRCTSRKLIRRTQCTAAPSVPPQCHNSALSTVLSLIAVLHVCARSRYRQAAKGARRGVASCDDHSVTSAGAGSDEA